MNYVTVTQQDLVDERRNLFARLDILDSLIRDTTMRPYDTEELYGADPNCDHLVRSATGGGIECKFCPGWYCA